MSSIYVEKKNQVFLRIRTEEGIEYELAEFFTFMAENYQFSPLFRERKWDGKIRLYNRKTKTLPFGLFKHLEIFAQERNYKLEGYKPTLENYSIEECNAFIESLDLVSAGVDIKAEPHQVIGVTKALRYRNVLLLSATGSGKSLIAYCIARNLLEKRRLKKGIIIVPTVSLVEQLSSDFTDYSTKNRWDAASKVQKLYEGQSRNIVSPITISTWQTLNQIDIPNFFDQFNFVIGDEAHTFDAKCLGEIMHSMIHAEYRIGMTGTTRDAKVHKLALEGHFGPTSVIAKTHELQEKGKLAPINIKSLILKYNDECAKFCYEMEYKDEMEYLISHPLRNNFIKNLTLSLKENTLVLFQYVEKHGQILYDMIMAANKDPSRKIYFVHGGVEKEDREAIRAIVEKENNAIIIASYGVFSTGINIKRLYNIIFASPSKSKVRVLQSIGRVLRKVEGKTAKLFDIADDLRYKNRCNFSLLHYLERVNLYHAEKFKLSTYNIGLYNGKD